MEHGAEETTRARWEKRMAEKPVTPSTTPSGFDVAPLYTPEDAKAIDFENDIGYPGEFPFTRGIYPSMYRGRLWTFREYSGFGTAEDTNTRYRSLLEQGMTGLSVALDLPTQIGFDSDDPTVWDEVGRVGVAIDSLADMERLFEGIPLDKVSTNFTINTTSAPILAMYMAVGEQQGVTPEQLRGTLQNDPLKEYIARGTWLFPVDAALRLTGDVMAFCAQEVPKFNPISVSGSHMQQAGATPVESVALAFVHALAYIDLLLERGLSIDDFAPRISWNLGVVGTDLFEEAARFRAARRLWARLVQERYQPKNPASCMLRFYAGSGGNTLTVEEPLNNIVRVAIEVMASALGGAQAVHACSYDEAYAIPTEEAQLIALRTQQIIGYEAGLTRTVDPLAGSYYVESLTNAAEQKMREVIDEVMQVGVSRAIETGLVQERIMRSALLEEQRMESGEKVVVGVNKFRQTEGAAPIELHRADPEAYKRQVERTERVRRERDAGRVEAALVQLAAAAQSDTNIMPAMVEAVKAYATIGEICKTLTDVFGLYTDPAVSVVSGNQSSGLQKIQAQAHDPKIRILVAKPGLDGHDRGTKTMALMLRDAGMEVIYTGIRNSVDAIVQAAIQEDVDMIGLSVLSGAHVGLTEQIMERLREKGVDDVHVVVGGVIPEADIEPLKARGAAAVFPGGTPFEAVVAELRSLVA
ncbi:protein meaA [Candidatus Entotheonella palauensis]|uniref:protein meaA n=1 Tax=Candidatus Entotheonella palauensis TaxID=93172 RepID=UPI002119B297|nr:protein meaA [Candidatus Entotheonella palauensis]